MRNNNLALEYKKYCKINNSLLWKNGDNYMQCKCIDNSSNNGNFTLGRIYKVKENVGIWQPILC